MPLENHIQPQKRDLVFFDVETPNRENNSICSIGIVKTTAQGKLITYKYFLINPQATFDPINVAIHNITDAEIIGQPDFATIWDRELAALMENSCLVAHNAVFDLAVLRKSLARYERHLDPCPWTCTMKLSQAIYPEAPTHKLDVICDYLGIPLRKHHEALSDAEACYHLFARMCKTGKVRPTEQWSTYNFDIGNEGIITRRQELQARENKARKVVDRLPDVVERSAGGVDIENSVFCLTGDFLMSPESKQPVIDMLVAQGGIYSKNLTLKCDYLIVGSLGSPFWKNGNYGSKIEKAMKNAESGKSAVRIIDEASIADIGNSFEFQL